MTYGLAYPQPYYDAEGDLLGVLDAEISLHDVSRFLASLEIGQSGHGVSDRPTRQVWWPIRSGHRYTIPS